MRRRSKAAAILNFLKMMLAIYKMILDVIFPVAVIQAPAIFSSMFHTGYWFWLYVITVPLGVLIVSRSIKNKTYQI